MQTNLRKSTILIINAISIACVFLFSFFTLTTSAQVNISSFGIGNSYIDDFTGFEGNADPANWVTTDAPGAASSSWGGLGSGTGTGGGKYSFGDSGAGPTFEGSIGFLPSSTRAIYASIFFVNNTNALITSFTIGYVAEHWRSAINGRNNGWEVDYKIGGGTYTNVPALTYIAPNTIATGGGPHGSQSLSQTIFENIAVGDTIEIRFFGDNGTGGGSRQGVAIDDFSFTPIGNAGSPNPEPANHVTGLAAAQVDARTATLNWVDSDTTNAAAPADGYLILGERNAATHTVPVDGTPVSNTSSWNADLFAVNVPNVFGANSYNLSGLSPNTAHTFYVYPYSNGATNIDYKTNGTIPSVTFTTAVAPDTLLATDFATDVIGNGVFDTFNVVGAQAWTHLGAGGMQMNGFSGGCNTNEDWLTLGYFNLAEWSNLQLMVDVSKSFSGDNLRLVYSSNYIKGNDPTTVSWDTIASINASGVYTYTTEIQSYNHQAGVFAFMYSSYGGCARWTLNNLEITGDLQSAVCNAPSGTNTSAATNNSISLNWTGGSNLYQIHYGVKGFTPGVGIDTNSVVGTSTTVSGLNAFTEYDFYIREFCGNSFSAWSSPETFITAAPAGSSIIHAWDFNTSTVQNDSIQAEFSLLAVAPSIAYIGTGGAMDLANGDGTTINARNNVAAGNALRPRNPSNTRELIFELPSTGFENLYLTFATERTSSGMLQQVISYTTDGISYTQFGDTVNVNTSFGLIARDFSSVTAANNNPNFAVKIIFLGNNTGTSGNNRFDNVILEGTPTNQICLPPSNLAAINVTDVSAELSWTSGGASVWNIQGGDFPYQLYSDSAFSINQNPFPLTDLRPLTTYQGYIQDSCTFDTSAWVGPITFTTLPPAGASLIHNWNFNTNNVAGDSIQAEFSVLPNAPFISYLGSGGALDKVNNDGSTFNARNGAIDGDALRARNPSDTRELLFQLPSTGYENLYFSYVVERTGSGQLQQVLLYTIDGINFQPIGDTVNLIEDFIMVSRDFTDIPQTNNNPNFAVKVLFFGNNTGTSGNNRFDNVVLEGSPLPPLYNISQILGKDANGVADSLGTECILMGTITTTNFRTSGYDLFFEDATGAVKLFNFSNVVGYTPSIGDSIWVLGEIGQFRGQIQMNPDSIVLLAANRPLPTPLSVNDITAAEANRIISLENVEIISGNWSATSSFNVNLRTQTGDTVVMRVINVTDVQDTFPAAPIGKFSVEGVVNQFSSTSAPFFGGYQIQPRFAADIYDTVQFCGGIPSNLSASNITETTAEISWNSDVNNWQLEYGAPGFTIGSGTIIDITTNPYTITGLIPDSTYEVIVRDSCLGASLGNPSLALQFTTLAPPLTCDPPSNLAVIDTQFNQATISWTTGGSGVWNIEYGISGFAQGSGTVATISNNPYVISNLMQSTNYDVYVQDSCAGLGVSAWVGPLSFATPAEPLPPLYNISQILGKDANGVADSLGTECILMGTITTTNFRTSGYDLFFEDATGAVKLFNFSNVVGYTPSIGDSIWVLGEIGQFRGQIQMNPDSIVLLAANRPLPTPLSVNDITAAEANRIISLENVEIISGNWSATSSFNVNLRTQTGDTVVMRVINVTDVQDTFPAAPIGKFSVEGVVNQFSSTSAPFFGGYQIQPRFAADIYDTVQFCGGIPSNLSASNITETTAEISWNSDVNNWQLEYGAPGFTIGSGTIIDVTTNPYTITGLIPDSTYEVIVKDSCLGASLGNPSLALQFTTLAPPTSCNDPDSISLLNTGPNNAVLSWISGGSAIWNIEFDTAGFTLGAGNFVTTTNNPYTISGLIANTTYDFYVQDTCPGTGLSNWVGPFTFTTDTMPLVLTPLSVDRQTVIIDFDGAVNNVNNGQYNNLGFSPNPVVGQLDANSWAMTGMSDGNMNFGDTRTSGDFARGFTNGGVSSGGFYAFGVDSNDIAAGFQPTGSDFNPGTFTLRVENRTGAILDTIAVAYDFYVYNDQPRSSYMTWSYSLDGTNFTMIASDTTPLAADPSPAWVASNFAENIALNLPPNAFFYLRWSSGDVAGGGSRDEFAIDNISLTPFVSTAGPSPQPTNHVTNFAASDIFEQSALLSWVDADTSGGAQAALGYLVLGERNNASHTMPVDGIPVADDLNWSNNLVAINVLDVGGANSLALSNLLANTTYNFYIYPYSNGGNSIDYKTDAVVPMTQFTTLNTPDTLVDEQFTTNPIGGGTWSTVQSSGSNNWSHQTTSGGGMNMNGFPSCNSRTWLIAGGFDMDAFTADRFNAEIFRQFSGNNLYLLYSNNYNGTDPEIASWDTIRVFTGTTNVVNDTSVRGLTGSNGYFAFLYDSSTSCASWTVRGFTVLGVAGFTSCNLPTNISAAADGTIGWTSGGSNLWNIEYGLQGFTQGTGNFLTVNTNPFKINGLDAFTDYEVYVRDTCPGFGSSAWAGPVAFTTTFPDSSDLIHYWNFNNMTLDTNGNVDNVPADSTVALITPVIFYQGSGTGYMDPVSGSTINTRLGEAAGDGLRVRNPSFNRSLVIPLSARGYEDLFLSYALERSGSGMLKQVLSYTLDGGNSYTAFGDTVFVQTSYEFVVFDLRSITAANDNNDFGVKIDFYENNIASNGNNRFDNIAFQGKKLPPSCYQPLNLAVTGTSQTTATVSWVTGGANQWQIEYGLAGFSQGNGTVVLANSNPFTITGLVPDTIYDVYVRDTCIGLGTSPWAGPVQAVTQPIATTCNDPSNLGAANITPSSADLSWTSGGSAVWNIEFGLTGFNQGSGTMLTVFANPFTLTNLNFGTTYDYYVQDSCSGLGSSNWVGPFTFTTTIPPCNDPTNISLVSVDFDQATIAWTTGGSSLWNVEYGISGFGLGNGNFQTTSNNPLTITGLAETTTYDVWIQDTCQGINTSQWVGPFTFTTPAEPVIPEYNISEVIGKDGNGIGDSLNVTCILRGTVTSTNFRSTGYDLFIQDATGGIKLFDFNPVSGYAPTLGDSIWVLGRIDQFRGQMQIRPDSIQVLATAVNLPDAEIVTSLSEAVASKLVKFEKVVLADTSQWVTSGSSFNVNIISSTGDTSTMRVINLTDVVAVWPNPPSDTFALTGVVNQFTGSSAPFLGGYQIFPRFADDIDTTSSGGGVDPIDTIPPYKPQLVINEVVTRNTSGISDATNSREDWIEIYNPTNEDLTLERLFITFSLSNPVNYRFPENADSLIVPANGFRILWASGDVTKGDNHLPFTLSSNGEFLALFATDTTIIDSVTVPAMAQNISYGRITDGNANWVFFSTTTPRSPNAQGIIQSIEEVGKGMTLKAYPNPNNGTELFFNQQASGNMFNITGQEVLRFNRAYSVQLNHLESGIYLLRTDEGETLRIVIH